MTVTWMQLAAPGRSATFRKTVTEADVHLFAGVVGDFSPVHTDETFAATTRFGRRIAHGAYSLGLLSAAASRLAGPAALPVQYDVTFRAPVLVGDTVAAEVRVTGAGPDDRHLMAAARVINQQGVVVAEGSILLQAIGYGPSQGGKGDG